MLTNKALGVTRGSEGGEEAAGAEEDRFDIEEPFFRRIGEAAAGAAGEEEAAAAAALLIATGVGTAE